MAERRPAPHAGHGEPVGILAACEGVTAIEYGLLGGAVAVAIVAAVLLLGGNLSGLFTELAGAIGDTGGSGGAIAAPAATGLSSKPASK
ncbi:MAG: Flp family type IVb pilin [Alphaproteobacteria bacterium]|nr:Flp family type IVb pilin [Alphaproteobacteria bacterium]